MEKEIEKKIIAYMGLSHFEDCELFKNVLKGNRDAILEHIKICERQFKKGTSKCEKCFK